MLILPFSFPQVSSELLLAEMLAEMLAETLAGYVLTP